MKFVNFEDIPGRTPPKHYDLLGRAVVDESDGTTFKVSYTRMDKTGRCDLHTHDEAEQLFIILKGKMMFKTKDREFTLEPGQAVLVHRGEDHCNWNIAEDGNTEYLTVTSIPKS